MIQSSFSGLLGPLQFKPQKPWWLIIVWHDTTCSRSVMHGSVMLCDGGIPHITRSAAVIILSGQLEEEVIYLILSGSRHNNNHTTIQTFISEQNCKKKIRLDFCQWLSTLIVAAFSQKTYFYEFTAVSS